MPQVSDGATRMPDSCSLRRRIGKSAFRAPPPHTIISGFRCVVAIAKLIARALNSHKVACTSRASCGSACGPSVFIRSQPVGQPLAIEQIAARAFGGGRAKGLLAHRAASLRVLPARTPFPIGVKGCPVWSSHQASNKGVAGAAIEAQRGLAGTARY